MVNFYLCSLIKDMNTYRLMIVMYMHNIKFDFDKLRKYLKSYNFSSLTYPFYSSGDYSSKKSIK